jgi:hypothetical protein
MTPIHCRINQLQNHPSIPMPAITPIPDIWIAVLLSPVRSGPIGC